MNILHLFPSFPIPSPVSRLQDTTSSLKYELLFSPCKGKETQPHVCTSSWRSPQKAPASPPILAFSALFQILHIWSCVGETSGCITYVPMSHQDILHSHNHPCTLRIVSSVLLASQEVALCESTYRCWGGLRGRKRDSKGPKK